MSCLASARVGCMTGTRRSRPDEHAHVDAMRGLGEQLSQRDHRGIRSTAKSGFTVQPATCTNERAPRTAADDGGERRRPVDVHVDVIALAWGVSRCPSRVGAAKCAVPAEPMQPADVMPAVGAFDHVAELAVGAGEHARRSRGASCRRREQRAGEPPEREAQAGPRNADEQSADDVARPVGARRRCGSSAAAPRAPRPGTSTRCTAAGAACGPAAPSRARSARRRIRRARSG